jgi:4-hydroxybenzoate polyprenyltransferase
MISGSADQKSMMLAALASFFIFTMYTINNYFTRGSLVSNNPGKSRLYLEHSQPLLQLSAVCAALSVYLLSYFGPGTVFLFSALALFGTIYSMPKIKSAVGRSWPKFLRRAYLFRSMHSGIAWIATAVIIPLMNINEIKHESVLIALTASIAIIARNILADCIIFNGDFIVGNETFPTLMGMGRCQALCVALLGIELTSVILLAANSGLLFAGLLAHIALSLHAVYMIHRHSHYYPLRYELQVDAAMLFFALPAIIL